jgi:N-methylhydantoinase A
VLLGVDVGGTFTDAVLVDSAGSIHTAKVPSMPSEESRAVLEAVAQVLSRAGAEPAEVERFAHGMTVATNALLEGRTARTALIATAGFTDVIELGRQARPHLYDLCASPPAPLVPGELRFPAPERMGPEGVVRALEAEDARLLVSSVAQAQPQAVAVSLLHSYADPAHEQLLGALLADMLPQASCSLSSDVVGTFREYERTATTVLDAALSPLLRSYLSRLERESREAGLPAPEVMQSSGGLTDAERAGAHAALTVLSGPAGGVGGALLLAELAGERDVLCFDMGGTSCDVCLIEGSVVAETAERAIAGRPLSLPALDIHTVGAGGGSIAWRDPGGALRVGPASAGARPGPACYGRGGDSATVTDANVLLGRMPADAPLAGALTLDRGAAERAIAALAHELGLDTLECAEGIVRVAEAEMLGALRLVTVERGIDPRGFVLMPFGGAGPLHAAAMADELGIERIVCPSASGVLSALGLAAAAPRRDVSRTLMLSGAELTRERLESERAQMLEQAQAALGTSAARVRVRHELRYAGQAFELSVEQSSEPDADALRDGFASAHEQRYGYRDDADIELVNMRVSVWGRERRPEVRPGGAARALTSAAAITVNGEHLRATVVRGVPEPGARLEGPALCALGDATLLIPPGWSAAVDAHGSFLVERAA